jgi:Na+-transporting methylmalonyl-CoA/oxaloacetate decarboxylase beta subunit
MRAPAPRTAVLGALLSAGIVVTMLATSAAHGPAPDPHPAAATVAVLENGGGPRAIHR